MQIVIGNHTYIVRLVKAPLRNDAGDVVAGLASWYRGEVLISDHVPPEKRRHVLLHELRHQWDNHFGGGDATDPESQANQTASFVELVADQIQPAEFAALRTEPQPAWLAPVEDWPPAEPGPGATAATLARPIRSQSLDGGRNTNPQSCCGMFPLRAVVNEPPIVDNQIGAMCRRAGYCPSCDHVMRWWERVGTAGLPTGVVLDAPEFLRGAEKDVWMAEHPDEVAAARAGEYDW